MKKFLIISLSPAVIFSVYDIVFYWLWVPFGVYSEEVIYSLAFFSLVNLALIIKTIYIVKKEKSDNVCITGGAGKSIKTPIILMLISAGIVALYLQLGGQLTLNLQEKYSEVYSQGIFYIVLMQIITYILIYDLYVGKRRPFVFFLVFLFIVLSALTGGRSGVVWLSLLLFFIAVLKFHLKWVHLIFVMFLIPAFFVTTSILRGTINLDGAGDTIGFLDFNQIFTYEETMQYTSQHGAQFSRFLGDVLDGFLPRSVNPNKNTSTAFTREVFPEVWDRTSYTSGFYANLLFVFGYSGLFLVPLFQIGINILYLKVALSTDLNKFNFFVLFFCLFPLLLVRGGIFEFRVVFALFLLGVALFLHGFLRKRFVLV